MESRSKWKNLGNHSGLILIIGLLLITGCGKTEKKLDTKIPDLPTILVMPFFTQGPQMPKMVDASETFIYLLHKNGVYHPRDLGEAIEIVNDYQVRGIYPGEELIKKIGSEQDLDYILIGKISSTSKKNNPLELISMKASEVEVRIRLINARTGRLKQVIHRQLKVEDSVYETINEIFLDIVNRL